MKTITKRFWLLPLSLVVLLIGWWRSAHYGQFASTTRDAVAVDSPLSFQDLVSGVRPFEADRWIDAIFFEEQNGSTVKVKYKTFDVQSLP